MRRGQGAGRCLGVATSRREDIVVSCRLLQFLGADGCVAMSGGGMCAAGDETWQRVVTMVALATMNHLPVSQARD
jgi:hypothetical protein|eukprot:COSAG01_NODE_2916_length_6860_cov_159.736430_2_plen_75_part_00